MDLDDGSGRIVQPSTPALGLHVNMTYQESTDSWIFATERRMTPLAFDRAKAKVRAYYAGVHKDLHPNDPFREELERALRALDANRVRNVVKSSLDREPF